MGQELSKKKKKFKIFFGHGLNHGLFFFKKIFWSWFGHGLFFWSLFGHGLFFFGVHGLFFRLVRGTNFSKI
jgi:hypothetical protein